MENGKWSVNLLKRFLIFTFAPKLFIMARVSKKISIILVIFGCTVRSLTAASDNKSPDNAVVPIDWSRFTVSYPNDANAALEKAIAQNAIRYALTGWYAERFGSQPANEYYLDILLGSEYLEGKVRGAASQAYGIATMIQLGLYDVGKVDCSSKRLQDHPRGAETIKVIKL